MTQLSADRDSQMVLDIAHASMPPAYRLMIIPSRPSRRRWPLGTSIGVKVPARSRGMSRSTSPTSVPIVLGLVPPAGVGIGSRVRVALVVAQMLAQLGLQTPFQGRLDHPRQQTIIACQRGASIHLSEDPIQRPRRLELLCNLTLPPASLSPLLIHAHTHSLVSFPLRSHPLTQTI